MTQVHHTAPHVTAREERIRVISEGVVASYIHDISTRTGPQVLVVAGELPVQHEPEHQAYEQRCAA